MLQDFFYCFLFKIYIILSHSVKLIVLLILNNIILLHVWKAIDHMVHLPLNYFLQTILILTELFCLQIVLGSF